MCLPVLIPGNGEDNPLCNIDSMVTNALQVFVDHQQVKRVLPDCGRLRDFLNQHSFDLCKIAVNGVIVSNHGSGPLYILLDVRIHALCDHFDCLLRHFADMAHIFRDIAL